MIEFELPNATGLFTTRTGGVSRGRYESLNVGRLTDDRPEDVERNIGIVQAASSAAEMQLLRQVHGGDLHVSDADVVEAMPAADSSVTNLQRRALLATGADCPPVALSDGETVAIVHCGWKPLAAGIIEATAERLRPGFHAAVGPGICVDHYEVGDEVIDALGEVGRQSARGRQLDLAQVITRKLNACSAADIRVIDRCTYCEPDRFFSHRRDGAITGRQAGLVWLN